MSTAPTKWWLANEPSGRFEVYYLTAAIKKSTLIRNAFETMSLFGLSWDPLPHQPNVIQFKVTKWEEINPHTAEKRGDSKNLAGLFSFTVEATTGQLLTVLSGPVTEDRLKVYYDAATKVSSKLSRQQMLMQFVDYAQSAAQQMVRALFCFFWSLHLVTNREFGTTSVRHKNYGPLSVIFGVLIMPRTTS